MSVVIYHTCREARHGIMDLKASVRHVGNAILNSVETSAQGEAYLVLQLIIKRISRHVLFPQTSLPGERTFLLKDHETLKEMGPRI